MKSSRIARLLVIACLALPLAGLGAAQEKQDNPDLKQRVEDRAARANEGVAAGKEDAGNANAGVAEILTNTTQNAEHTAEAWGRRLGLGKDASFLLSILVNFAGIVLFLWVLLKSKLAQAFRDRTTAIQKGIREAQAASEDANRRLSAIEARLSKLDAEVAEIRQSAEREAATEEERIRQAAEHDKQKIVEGAEAEIDAIARNARRELKGFAASLAVDLAARRIQVDERTDQALVREFVGQLGKDGH